MNSDSHPDQKRPGAAIRFQAVSRSFADTGLVLDQISFQVEAGEFVAVLGPSLLLTDDRDLSGRRGARGTSSASERVNPSTPHLAAL